MSQEENETTSDDSLENPTDNSMAAFSPEMNELEDALSLLYIRKNASGRNKFREKWPDVALYLFGETLIKYDYEGTQDWDHRSKLEEEAGQRRVLLKETIVEIIDKSVDSGVLQFDYVSTVINQFGIGLSKSLYAEDVIERVRPGHSSPVQNEEDTPDQGDVDPPAPSQPKAEDEKLSAEEKSILSNTAEAEKTSPQPSEAALETQDSIIEPPKADATDEPFDSVQPIQTESTVEKQPEPVQEEAPTNEPQGTEPAQNENTAPNAPTARKGTYVLMFNALASIQAT